jgi:hypothetical protein
MAASEVADLHVASEEFSAYIASNTRKLIRPSMQTSDYTIWSLRSHYQLIAASMDVDHRIHPIK